jgi:hypothetical protein
VAEFMVEVLKVINAFNAASSHPKLTMNSATVE